MFLIAPSLPGRLQIIVKSSIKRVFGHKPFKFRLQHPAYQPGHQIIVKTSIWHVFQSKKIQIADTNIQGHLSGRLDAKSFNLDGPWMQEASLVCRWRGPLCIRLDGPLRNRLDFVLPLGRSVVSPFGWPVV